MTYVAEALIENARRTTHTRMHHGQTREAEMLIISPHLQDIGGMHIPMVGVCLVAALCCSQEASQPQRVQPGRDKEGTVFECRPEPIALPGTGISPAVLTPQGCGSGVRAHLNRCTSPDRVKMKKARAERGWPAVTWLSPKASNSNSQSAFDSTTSTCRGADSMERPACVGQNQSKIMGSLP